MELLADFLSLGRGSVTINIWANIAGNYSQAIFGI